MNHQAAQNAARAEEIIARAGIVEAWGSVGAQVNRVGSLATGLLAKHLDIDFHIYTDSPTPQESFSAMSRIASRPEVERIEYANLLATPEECLEWHAFWRDDDSRLWQIDMIHIRRGSRYDGFAERMVAAISASLTDDMRETILRLKFETPDSEKIPGVFYYAAVMSYGITDYAGLKHWLAVHSGEDFMDWLP